MNEYLASFFFHQSLQICAKCKSFEAFIVDFEVKGVFLSGNK